MTIPNDHIVAVVVPVIIMPRLVVMVRLVGTMIVGSGVVVLRPSGPRRDEGDRRDGCRC